MSYQLLAPADDDVNVAIVASAEAVTVKTSTSKIPEAQGLTWTDSFFETSNTNGVIAVFDVNYDLVRWRIRFAQAMVMSICIFYCGLMALPSLLEGGGGMFNGGIGFFYVYMLGLMGFCIDLINKQLKFVNGIHLAVTEEGIHKVTNGFPIGAIFRTTTVVRFVCVCVYLSASCCHRCCCGCGCCWGAPSL